MGTANTLEHECRQARTCKSRTRDDEGHWRGAGVDKPRSLCPECEDAAFTAIGHLTADYWALTDARTEQTTTAPGQKVSGSGERSIPIRLAVDTLMSTIEDETLRWTLRITHGDPLPHHHLVERCVTILSANLPALLDLPVQPVTVWFPYPYGGDWDGRKELGGVDAVIRLARLHDRAQSLLGLVETTAWLQESCHVCGLRTLMMDMDDPDDALVKCRGCGNVWHQDEFTKLNNPLAA